MSFPLFSGIFASLIAATVLAPDDIPTYRLGFSTRNKQTNHLIIYLINLSKKMRLFISDLGVIDERYIAKQIYCQLGRDYENIERHIDGENEAVHY